MSTVKNLRLDHWRNQEQPDLTGASLAAWKVEKLGQIGRNKPPRSKSPFGGENPPAPRARDFQAPPEPKPNAYEQAKQVGYVLRSCANVYSWEQSPPKAARCARARKRSTIHQRRRVRCNHGDQRLSPSLGYEPTPEELAAGRRVGEKLRVAKPLPQCTVTKVGNTTSIKPQHSANGWGDILLMDALGVSDFAVSQGLMWQVADVSRSGAEVKAHELNFMLSLIRGIGPRDDIEALLAAQMAAIHKATMTAAWRLAHVETIVQQDLASTMVHKLARTFAMQVEALKRYRSSGEQTIKVQHVTINDGGQAIVGTVHAWGRGMKKEERPYEPRGTDEPGAALLGHLEAITARIPSTGSEGLDRVPVPRRSRRRSERSG